MFNNSQISIELLNLKKITTNKILHLKKAKAELTLRTPCLPKAHLRSVPASASLYLSKKTNKNISLFYLFLDERTGLYFSCTLTIPLTAEPVDSHLRTPVALSHAYKLQLAF